MIQLYRLVWALGKLGIQSLQWVIYNSVVGTSGEV